MRVGRRTFLKLVTILSAFTYALRPARARAEESAVSIHRATRNTLLGAIGAGLREMQAPLQPFKTYRGRERIHLGPKPATTAGAALVEALDRAYAGAKEKIVVSSEIAGISPSNGAPTARVATPPTFTRDVLARLLFFANGDTDTSDGEPYKLRAAPSAGALYAGELYVVALAVGDLERGVYYYDVGAHALVRVRGAAELPPFADAFENPAIATNVAALVLISNVFERYKQRYSNRGYRYALVDTGHIGENLRIAAAAAGIEHGVQPRFVDAQLSTLLAIDGNDEAVCAVHVLGPGAVPMPGAGTPVPGTPAANTRDVAPSADVSAASGTGTAATDVPARTPVEENTATATRRFVEKTATGAHITDDSDPTVRYHEATALVVGEAKRRGEESGEDESVNPGAQDTQPPLTLANAAPAPSTSAEACIASRRSPKSFIARAISAAQLGFVVRAAYPLEASRRSVGLELQLVVHRVEGVSPGLYRYVPEQGGLDAVRVDDFTESLPRVCLGQSKAGDASAGFVMVADIRRAAAAHGQRVYRDLLIEAGEMGERIYLAAEALGLSARNLASFIDEDLNSLLGLDGGDVAVVHLTMLGHGA